MIPFVCTYAIQFHIHMLLSYENKVVYKKKMTYGLQLLMEKNYTHRWIVSQIYSRMNNISLFGMSNFFSFWNTFGYFFSVVYSILLIV